MKLAEKVWNLINEEKLTDRSELQDAFEEESDELEDNFNKNQDKFPNTEFQGGSNSIKVETYGKDVSKIRNIMKRQASRFAGHYGIPFASSFSQSEKFAQKNLDCIYYDEERKGGDGIEIRVGLTNSRNGFHNKGSINRKGDDKDKDRKDDRK